MNNKKIFIAMLIAAFATAGCAKAPQKLQDTKIENTKSATESAAEDLLSCDLDDCQEQDANILMDELF
ncbi:hypothetical protein OTK49_01130 [Vibrio coralliirubri]|uniref:hypothetical protein n=1 Tax=Vibrio coralliirubri TaxID=1516159 RepID=UPI0022853506|nr:hypothetical protein [Vibrio coralliirubri]MCY9861132.1 hypothetical protein [Vibrio coralliirubri]